MDMYRPSRTSTSVCTTFTVRDPTFTKLLGERVCVPFFVSSAVGMSGEVGEAFQVV